MTLEFLTACMALFMFVVLSIEFLILRRFWRMFLSESQARFQLGLHEMWTALLLAALGLYLLIDVWRIRSLILGQIEDWMVCFFVVLVFWSISNGISAALLFHRKRFPKQDAMDAPLMTLVGGLAGVLQIETATALISGLYKVLR